MSNNSNNSNNIDTNTMRSLVEAANRIDGISEAAVGGGDPMVEFDRLREDIEYHYERFMSRSAKMKKAYAEGNEADFMAQVRGTHTHNSSLRYELADIDKIPLIDGFKKKHGKNR